MSLAYDCDRMSSLFVFHRLLNLPAEARVGPITAPHDSEDQVIELLTRIRTWLAAALEDLLLTNSVWSHRGICR